MAFLHVLDHVSEHTAYMFIGGQVEDAFAASLGAHETGSTQQTQVMARKGRRHAKLLSQVLHAHRLIQTGAHQAQAIGITEKVKHLGKLDRLICCQCVAHGSIILTYKYMFKRL